MATEEKENEKIETDGFRYVEEVPSETGTRNERASIPLHVWAIVLLDFLAMAAGILLAVFGGILSSRSRLFSQWGVGGVLSLVLLGALLFLLGLVDTVLVLLRRKGKDLRFLSFLSKSLPYLSVAGFLTAFSLILLRPEAIESHLHSANAFPYFVGSGWVVIALSWILALGMSFLESFLKKREIVLSLRYVLLVLCPYLPLVFYPLLTKSYVLSPSTPGILLLVFGAIGMDLSALFLALKSKTSFALLFRLFFLLSLLLLSSALIFYGLGTDRISL